MATRVTPREWEMMRQRIDMQMGLSTLREHLHRTVPDAYEIHALLTQASCLLEEGHPVEACLLVEKTKAKFLQYLAPIHGV